MVSATKTGRYEILDELGRGGMGVVYRAKDPAIGRIVALKAIHLSEEGTGLSHAQLVEHFQTEARAAGRLTHANIVTIYDVGESEGLYYITMELVNGKSLQSVIDSSEKFPLFRIIRIMEQICSALQYAHDQRVVHRDIKPANIMLAGEDFVKITDFGTAQILQYGAAQQTSSVGTPAYMSPEQIKGKAVDGRTDIFSLGVILYELSTGRKPFAGQDIASILHSVLNTEPTPPHLVNRSLPPGVGSTIMKALSKSPHLRYETCRELLEDLKYYRPGEVPGHSAASATATESRTTVREKIPIRDRNYEAPMPKIPGVEPRRAASAAPPLKSASPAPKIQTGGTGGGFPEEAGHQSGGIYTGPPRDVTASLKRIAQIAAGIVLAALLASWAFSYLGRAQRRDFEVTPAMQESPSIQPPVSQTNTLSARTPAIASNSDIATVSELARPWSSKGFVFQSMAHSKYVPALIIRLPGAASGPAAYWAFSLEVPFSDCQLVYMDNLEKLSSDFGFDATHPMIVNPCNGSIYDPLQHKTLPGNIFVRGAVVHGSDLRPPIGIELKVTGNHIRAIAME